MFLALWAIVILPQQRRVRAHNALVNVLEEGDEVMTTSGILGTITQLDDEVLHLEVAPGVTLRVVRGAVARRMNEPEPEPEPESTLDDEPEAAHDEPEAALDSDTVVDHDAPLDTAGAAATADLADSAEGADDDSTADVDN
jgi:preprotein translocase subunit YajC